jgi:CheY-like chemotaxis protein
MSLIKCSDCGTRSSNQAASCLKCGVPATALPVATKKKRGATIRVIASRRGVIPLLVDVSVNAISGRKPTGRPRGVVASAPFEPQSVREQSVRELLNAQVYVFSRKPKERRWTWSAPSPPPAVTYCTVAVPNARLLIIDDDAAIVDVLRMSLELQGYATTTCATGAEALRLIEHTRLEAILLDLSLPDTDGLVLIPVLKRLSDMPILVLSARRGQVDRVLSLRLGADGFLSKPFDLDELHARLATILRRTMDPPRTGLARQLRSQSAPGVRPLWR